MNAAAHGAPNAAAHAAHNADGLAPPAVRPSMSVVAKELSSGKHTTRALPPWDIFKSQVKNHEVACKPFGGYYQQASTVANSACHNPFLGGGLAIHTQGWITLDKQMVSFIWMTRVDHSQPDYPHLNSSTYTDLDNVSYKCSIECGVPSLDSPIALWGAKAKQLLHTLRQDGKMALEFLPERDETNILKFASSSYSGLHDCDQISKPVGFNFHHMMMVNSEEQKLPPLSFTKAIKKIYDQGGRNVAFRMVRAASDASRIDPAIAIREYTEYANILKYSGQFKPSDYVNGVYDLLRSYSEINVGDSKIKEQVEYTMNQGTLKVLITDMVRVLKALDNTNKFIRDCLLSAFGNQLLLESEGKAHEIANDRTIIEMPVGVSDDQATCWNNGMSVIMGRAHGCHQTHYIFKKIALNQYTSFLNLHAACSINPPALCLLVLLIHCCD